MSINQPSKVFVLCQKNFGLTVSKANNILIICCWRNFRNSRYFISFIAQRSHHSKITTLIYEKIHQITILRGAQKSFLQGQARLRHNVMLRVCLLL